eukprot:6211226-Pleurochrysis_carterae.AAC.1
MPCAQLHRHARQAHVLVLARVPPHPRTRQRQRRCSSLLDAAARCGERVAACAAPRVPMTMAAVATDPSVAQSLGSAAP